MGIDFSHCDAHWAYSGFNRFRLCLANEIGVDLDKMEGFSDKNKPISWDKVKDDIKPLLSHSDCDGILTSAQCKKVAPRLRQLVKAWDDDDYDKINALRLAEGMDSASKANEDFEFC